MIQKIKRTIVSLVAASALFAPLLVPATVAAATAPDTSTGLCQGASLQVSSNCSPTDIGQKGTDRVNSIIKTTIDLFSLVVGVVAVIMVIIGGLKYITSSGDSGNITGAKNTILYAIIGLVVVALAQFIVQFVLGKVTP